MKIFFMLCKNLIRNILAFIYFSTVDNINQKNIGKFLCDGNDNHLLKIKNTGEIKCILSKKLL